MRALGEIRTHTGGLREPEQAQAPKAAQSCNVIAAWPPLGGSGAVWLSGEGEYQGQDCGGAGLSELPRDDGHGPAGIHEVVDEQDRTGAVG